MQRFNIIGFLILISLVSCNSGNSRLNIDLSDTHKTDILIKRYGKDLFNVNPENIKAELFDLSKKYPVFLNADLNDTLNVIQLYDFITDPQLIDLHDNSQLMYPELKSLEEELTSAFHHYAYYFPASPIPEIYTYISGLHYEYPVQLGDNIIVIGLDLYLGNDFDTYRKIGIPEYKAARMNADHIGIDCMKEMAFIHLPQQNVSRTFLDEIINNGKILYFLDATMPEKADHLKIGYTPEQLQWCEASEENLWAFFIEKQMLYSSDFQVIKKFCLDGPFTAALSNDSPGAIGNWMGWQIVRAYMNENANISLHALLIETDSQMILSKSKYKPGR